VTLLGTWTRDDRRLYNDVSATDSPDEDLGPAETDCSRKGRTGKQGLLVGAGGMIRLSTEHHLGPLFTSFYAVACLGTGNVVYDLLQRNVFAFPMPRSSERFLFRGRFQPLCWYLIKISLVSYLSFS